MSHGKQLQILSTQSTRFPPPSSSLRELRAPSLVAHGGLGEEFPSDQVREVVVDKSPGHSWSKLRLALGAGIAFLARTEIDLLLRIPPKKAVRLPFRAVIVVGYADEQPPGYLFVFRFGLEINRLVNVV